MTISSNERNNFTINYTDRLVTLKLTEYLRSIVPSHYDSYVICCIGTDRSTGDSLGPLTGSLLQRQQLHKLVVYGTLHEPLHALNLVDCLQEIKVKYKRPFVIAVDAALGQISSIGKFFCGIGPLHPGSALKKDLPEVGHIHVSATVNLNSGINYLILQNTRLSVVYDMAMILANCFYRLDVSLANPSKYHFAK